MKYHQKPLTYVELVELKVMDLERSNRFYQEVLGFRVLEKTENKIIYTADGETGLVSITRPAEVTPKPPKTTGLYHLAILLPSRADLGAFLRHAIESNIQLGASDHIVSEALYLNDPDGNGIEIYRDRPDDEWNWEKGNVAMDSLQLDGAGVLKAGQHTAWKGMPKDTLMGHIHLQVADLKATQQFYEILGFELVTPYPGALFMSSGKYHHHIGFNTWAGQGAQPAPKSATGLEAFTVVYSSFADREEAVRQLVEQGIPVTEKHGVFITEDPSENRMKLVVKE